MCIIVDANCASHLSNKTEDGTPILNWLLRGKGGLIVGGLLTTELAKAGLREVMVTLNRAGRLKRIGDDEISNLTKILKEKKTCVSNDEHVLAIAILSNGRLIFTKDQKLQQDAKNKKILSPKAAIYGSKKHKHLLKDCKC